MPPLRGWALLFEGKDVFNRPLEQLGDKEGELEGWDVISLFHGANRLPARSNVFR